jgi:hypothetical protein
MKAIFVALAIMPLMFTTGGPAGDGADLTAYLDQIRASGISEMGRSDLYMIAGICSGSTILDYKKDPDSGQYWTSYMSATCPKPGADAPELTRWKALKVSETEAMVSQFKPIADADGSGFVTTKEAASFRYAMEYGYVVARVVRDEGASIESVARASGKDVESARRALAEYKELARRATAAGIACLPDVTI